MVQTTEVLPPTTVLRHMMVQKTEVLPQAIDVRHVVVHKPEVISSATVYMKQGVEAIFGEQKRYTLKPILICIVLRWSILLYNQTIDNYSKLRCDK